MWTKELPAAFDSQKQALSEASVLQVPDFSKVCWSWMPVTLLSRLC